MRDRALVEAVVAHTVAEFGGIDILVNNAMITNRMTPIASLADSDMDLTYQTGPLAATRFTQACFPYLKARGGRVINIGSAVGVNGMKDMGPYAAAKEAIRALTRSAAREWGEFGITVNCICPKAITEATTDFKERFPEEYLRATRDIPLRRWGDPDTDVAPVVYSSPATTPATSPARRSWSTAETQCSRSLPQADGPGRRTETRTGA